MNRIKVYAFILLSWILGLAIATMMFTERIFFTLNGIKVLVFILVSWFLGLIIATILFVVFEHYFCPGEIDPPAYDAAGIGFGVGAIVALTGTYLALRKY